MPAAVSTRTGPRHAGLDPRHGFLPPRIMVYHLPSADEAGWETIPAVPLLTDLAGESIPRHEVRIQLAHDAQCLHLRADVREARPVVHDEVAPDHPAFWRQDHIEFRLLPDVKADLEQVQFILAASGRVFDSLGLWRRPDAAGLRFAGGPTAGGWQVTLSVPAARLGWRDGGASGCQAVGVLRGLVAYCRWTDGARDIACATPAALGFPHAERFAEFVFQPSIRGLSPQSADEPFLHTRLEAVRMAPGPLAVGLNRATLELHNRGPEAVAGHVRVEAHDGLGAVARTQRVPARLAPGLSSVDVLLELARPRYTRFEVWFERDGTAAELGAFTLRGAPPPFTPRRPLQHPYLLFDADGLEHLRAKLARPFSAESATDLSRPAPTDPGQGLPDADDPHAFDFTPSCMNWFRVAKESMLRDGAGGRRPALARIWRLLPEPAHEALQAVVRDVVPGERHFSVLLPAFNALLRRRDLYDAAAFADVGLPPEARASLARGLDHLAEPELMRLNRTLLQSAIECLGAFRLHVASEAAACLGPWLSGRDPAWLARATRCLAVADRSMIPGHQTHLHEGMLGGQLALAYDAFQPALTAAQRTVWLRVMERLLDLYLDTARVSAWTVTANPNANPVDNGGSGLLALCLLNEMPGKAREALAFARRYVWAWLDYCQGVDGGNTEGAQYWQYGMDNFLPFALALDRTLGHDDGLLAHPSIRRAMNMVRAGLTNDGGLHGVNDTIPLPVGGAVAWFAAGRFGDRLGLWYGDHCRRTLAARRAAGQPTAYGASPLQALLFRPDVPEEVSAPPLPTVFRLDDIQCAVARSSPEWDCALVAGLKGSRPPYTHHNQPDTGSFSLDVRGERLLIDPGYYKPDPTHHCLPVINGRGPVPPDAFTGEITVCDERGAVRYLACDSSAAYAQAGWRVVRHLVMLGERALVVFDDIEAPVSGGPGEVVSWFQCGAPTQGLAGGRGIRVCGRQSELLMRFHGPRDCRVNRLPERTLHDTHWGYHFAACRWFPVTVTYRAEAPLLTVIAVGGAAPEVSCRTRASSARFAVAAGPDLSVAFERHGDGWTMEWR